MATGLSLSIAAVYKSTYRVKQMLLEEYRHVHRAGGGPTPCPDLNTLGKLLRDELVGHEACAVEDHIGSCLGCQQVLQRLVGSLPGTRPESPAPPSSGDGTPSVPGHEIIGLLGEGGMGVVYKAVQTAVGRVVALKMIRGGLGSESQRARFRAEAEAAAKLTHPGIVRVYEVGESAGVLYFTLEFCDGGSLENKLDGTPWHPTAAARLIEMIADAVAAAHKQGIVHRDLKPANILLARVAGPDGGTVTNPGPEPSSTPRMDPTGRCRRWTDFGISKRLDSPDGPTQCRDGHPSYMAPEQASGEQSRRPPADVYALGAVLYELLTGHPPFKAQGWWKRSTSSGTRSRCRWARSQPELSTRSGNHLPEVPPESTGERYVGAAELADDLRRFQESRPIAAPRSAARSSSRSG